MPTNFDIQNGVLNGPNAAYTAAYQGQLDKQKQQSQQDAALAQLIKGKQMEAENTAAAETQKHDFGQSDIAGYGKQAQDLMDANKGNHDKVNVAYGPHGVNIQHADLPDPQLMRQKMMQDKAIKNANVEGYSLTDPDNNIPSPKARQDLIDVTKAVKNSDENVPKLKEQLANASPLDRFGSMAIGPVTLGTANGQQLEQKKTAALDYMRQLHGIGVLRPGELPLMEKHLGNITGVGSMLRKPEDTNKLLDEVMTELHGRADQNARASGYTPKQGYLAKPQAASQPSSAPAAHPQDSAAVNWARSNPKDPRSAAILKANGAQ